MSGTNSSVKTFDDLQLLTKISELLTHLDMDEVVQQTLDQVVRAVGAVRGSVFMFEGRSLDWQHVVYSEGAFSKQKYAIIPHVLSKGLAAWVIRNKQAVIIKDTLKDERWVIDTNLTDPARSALCIPAFYNNEIVAVLTFVHTEPNYFNEHHLRVLTIVANQIMVTIRQTQMVNRIEAQQRQLETIINAIPDPILVLDAQGHILLANQTGQVLLENKENQPVIGQRIGALTLRDNAAVPVQQILLELADTPLQPGTHWSFETRSEDLKRDFQATMTVWKDEAHQTVGYVVVMHNVTTLRDLHRFKDEMLRVASHDLKSPLSLIIGYVDMISLDLMDDTSPIHEYVDVIRRSSERMSNLVDDLLRVERIRSSPLELHEQLDLQKLLKVVLVNMRLPAKNKKQQLDSDIQLDGAPNIIGDPVLIRQAMENLIGNAIKYTPEGGLIQVRSYVEEDWFYFVVDDNGYGIPKDDLPRVFQSFYRVKSKNTTGIQGTGLGLSLVQTVIQRHNGEIWVESEEGRGSRFSFKLPVVNNAL